MPLPPGKDEWQMPYPSGTETGESPTLSRGGTLGDLLDTSINPPPTLLSIQFCDSSRH